MDGQSPAEVLQPLYSAATTKLGSKVTFKQYWKEKGLLDIFKMSKRMIMAATQIAHPDPAAPIALTTDASKVNIGGVLEQFVQGKRQPPGFWSRHLKTNQKAWTTFKRELYAIQQGTSRRRRMADT